MDPAPTRTVLALMAHPDDAEILCGGTLVRLAERGWRVAIASMTAGDCGSAERSAEDIAAIRREEARRAAATIGASYHCLERKDLEVFYERESLVAACGVLRTVRPALIITHSPEDYMLDHEETSRVARAAAFNAPIPNAPGPPGSEPLDAIPHLYYADPLEGRSPLGREIRPSLLVDIADVEDTKLRMLACHASQRDWLHRHHGIDEYLDSVRRWARARGALAGLAAAEGFRQHLGHSYPASDILAEELRAHVRRPAVRRPS